MKFESLQLSFLYCFKPFIKNIKSEIKNHLKDLKFIKGNSIAANEYYDENITDMSGTVKSEKFIAMEIDLKDLLARLLEKRKLAKRNLDIEVNLFSE